MRAGALGLRPEESRSAASEEGFWGRARARPTEPRLAKTACLVKLLTQGTCTPKGELLYPSGLGERDRTSPISVTTNLAHFYSCF